MFTTTNTTTVLRNGFKLKLKQGTCGAHHDPYGWTTLYAERATPFSDAGLSATLHDSGLGNARLELHAADGKLVRRLEEQECRATFKLKSILLFRRHVGFDPCEAEELLEAQLNSECEDPMGHPSRYV